MRGLAEDGGLFVPLGDLPSIDWDTLKSWKDLSVLCPLFSLPGIFYCGLICVWSLIVPRSGSEDLSALYL